MLNIKQIVSRKEENGVYSSKRGLMEHVKRRKVGVYRVILVNMVISVILGHEKTKIQNILDLGKIDVFFC